jgi:hypothetical protein
MKTIQKITDYTPPCAALHDSDNGMVFDVLCEIVKSLKIPKDPWTTAKF